MDLVLPLDLTDRIEMAGKWARHYFSYNMASQSGVIYASEMSNSGHITSTWFGLPSEMKNAIAVMCIMLIFRSNNKKFIDIGSEFVQ